MSASGALRMEGRGADKAVKVDVTAAVAGADVKTGGAASAAEAKLAVALEALTSIAGVSDLTSLGALFHVRRRAEEALFRIRAIRDEKRPSA